MDIHTLHTHRPSNLYTNCLGNNIAKKNGRLTFSHKNGNIKVVFETNNTYSVPFFHGFFFADRCDSSSNGRENAYNAIDGRARETLCGANSPRFGLDEFGKATNGIGFCRQEVGQVGTTIG